MEDDNILKGMKKSATQLVEEVGETGESIFKKANKALRPIFNYVEKNINQVFVGLLIILLIIFVLNIFSTSIANSTLKEKVELIKEANKPIKVELVIINCEDCFNIIDTLDSVKKQNIETLNEKNLDSDSTEAKELISKYNIQKLPSIIITGEINTERVKFNDFELVDDALILKKIDAPFLDLNTNQLQGQVSIIEITESSCDFCTSLSFIGTGFAESGVLISDWKKVEYNSVEGKEVISKYNIKKVPTILISNDIDHYEGVKEGLIAIGAEEKQGYYALHSTVPPYRDLTTNKIAGLVELIMLIDNSCSDCYDVNTNKKILTQFGIRIEKENTYDITSAEGKNLISKYDIDKVPIIILSPDAKEYDSFVQAWNSVGTKEDDGWYIMRRPEGIGKIKEI